MHGETFLLEQVVYGSFAFSDRGYAVLARSPGVREEWLAPLLIACQRFGEAPHGVVAAPALFSLQLGKGPRAVVGAFPQGCDDRGRPGAMAFHALLITDRDFRRAGGSPFAFAGCLRGEWTVETSSLPPLPCRPEPTTVPGDPSSEDPRVRPIVAALTRGRRVALESDVPIDALARGVWACLPEPVRLRASMASWAFGNENRFDLVALPRLAGVPLDASYLLPGSLSVAEPIPDAPDPGTVPGWLRVLQWVSVAVAVAVIAVMTSRRESRVSTPSPIAAAIADEALAPLGPDARERASRDLAAIAERFGVPASGDPAEVMARFSAQVRYRGPILAPDEYDRLSGESDREGREALAWHAQVLRLADDRPLPGEFDRLPFERQLATFLWSYHLPPLRDPADVPAILDEYLARPGPVVPTPLAAKYPALSDYARFLMRLPRRNGDGPP